MKDLNYMYEVIEWVNEVIGTVFGVMFLISLILTGMGYGIALTVYFAAFILMVLTTCVIEMIVVFYNENRNEIEKESEA